jgi:hypothetical protein
MYERWKKNENFFISDFCDRRDEVKSVSQQGVSTWTRPTKLFTIVTLGRIGWRVLHSLLSESNVCGEAVSLVFEWRPVVKTGTYQKY